MRKLLKKVGSLAAIPQNPQLLLEQYRVFSYQVPLLYVILMINTWAVAATHFSSAPRWLTVLVPGIMSVGGLVRATGWIRKIGETPTPEIAYERMRRTNRLASIIAASFTVWALCLFRYGDAYAEVHVAFYMAITVIGVIFCLMHLRSAAIMVAAIVNGAFVVFFALSDNVVFIAIAINTALVCIAMLVVLLVHYKDFTRMVDAQVENFRLANHDSLTGLPNRRAFFSMLQRAFLDATAKEGQLALGILDLDGFKTVNDLHGHPAGDRLLIEVGQRLCEVLTKDIHLSRLGGDEFALILTGAMQDTEITAVGNRVCEALSRPFQLGDLRVQIAGTIGFSICPGMAETATDLFEYADYALYFAKRSRRGRSVLFSAEHKAAIMSDAGIEQALQLADLDVELTVVYQPIVDVNSLATVGFEALARWRSPELGCVSPARFIPVAERAGIVRRLTQILLRKAIAAANDWPSSIGLSFNLSAEDLSSDEAVSNIIRIVAAGGIDPRRIDFEITETSFIQELAFESVQRGAQALRTLGCGISLDDFGTGYSSLSHLHELPLTKIKIDRSFVTDVHRNPASYKIVKSLLALSRDMGLECIVEGVEVEEEFATITDIGHELVQGYYCAKPMSAADVHLFLSAQDERSPSVKQAPIKAANALTE